jgi:hypothetical protein
MNQNHTYKNRLIEMIKTIFISLFIISSMALNAQTPVNFSGQWEFDKARSDKDVRGDASFDGVIIMEIKQDAESISFTNTFILPGKDGRTYRPQTYLLDGTVTNDDTGTDPAIKYSEWSQDKKILTTIIVMTATLDGEAQEFLYTMTYTLSEDGKTLFVDDFRKSKLNGEKTIKKVYSKK